MKTPTAIFRVLIITAVLAGQVQAQNWLTNGLVAYYPFNGNANDASGNGNNGVVYGAVLTQDRFGSSNSSYLFNGTNIYIQVSKLLPDLTNLTISAWVQYTSGSLNGRGDIY